MIAAIPKDALVMDANQMKAGTTRFLNGNWRVMVDVKDPVSGKAPSLRYRSRPIKALRAWCMVTTLFVVLRFFPVCISQVN